MILFNNDLEALFIKRPNRFIIFADIDGEEVRCHCPNTGRMGELLYPGVKIILEESRNPERKTKFSVVAVYKKDLIVPITSVRANRVAENIVIPALYNNPLIKREVTFQKSRFDFLIEDSGEKTFIEVKSCTLFEDDEAIFPDAPTSRGVKHLRELKQAVDNGYKGAVILIVFNPYSVTFSPNRKTDPEFSETLEAIKSIIKVIPFKVGVDKDGKIYLPAGDPVLPVVYK